MKSANSPDISRFAKIALFSVVLIAIIIFSISLYSQSQMPQFSQEASFVNNLGIFLLINLNIVVMMVLGFVVFKNLVKLVFDRKRKILGSKLRSRLVGAFIGLALVPTVLLFLVSKGILERVLEGWFSPQVVASVDGALEVASFLYDSEEARVRRHVQHISEEMGAAFPNVLRNVGESLREDANARDALEYYLEQKRSEYGLFAISVIAEDGEVLVETLSSKTAAHQVSAPGPNLARLHEAISGKTVVEPEQGVNGEFLRGYAPVSIPLGGGVYFASVENEHQLDQAWPAYVSLVGTVWISPQLNEMLATVIGAYDDYKELRSYRRPLASSYMLTLVVFTLMIVFAAIWAGFYLARGISVPIQNLAEGTDQVAHGNLDFQIPEVGDDELSVLVRSFNKMTLDLKQITGELVGRRRYMEAVLASVGVGVASVDKDENITTLNGQASEMLNLGNPQKAISCKLPSVFPEALSEKVIALLSELYQGDDRVLTENVSVDLNGDSKHIHITATKLVDDQGEILGSVLLFEDLTELVSAQRMAAWREVARRVAHEIKNPLTPIQLSAQRLQRKFGVENGKNAAARFGRGLSDTERGIIGEATSTIVHQVETLRSLVNEFSRFARMPTSDRKAVDLNAIINETVKVFREAHQDVEFIVSLDDNIPVIELDGEQMGRALLNLVDNGVSSVSLKRARLENSADCNLPGIFNKSKLFQRFKTLYQNNLGFSRKGPDGFCPRIVINSRFDAALGLVSVEIMDNGLGIAEENKKQVFEPYFSTKTGGSGLGLAIVNTIVADHEGFIRVRDSETGGAVFVIELPVTRQGLQKVSQI